MPNPPRKYMFPTEQDPLFKEYIPPRTRDPRREALFKESSPGAVVPWQQMVASKAAEIAFKAVAPGVNSIHQPMRPDNIANVLSTASYGSAFYAFVRPVAESQMSRAITLPHFIDRDSGEKLDDEVFRSKIQRGLSSAAELSEELYQLTAKGRLQKQIDAVNVKLGRVFAENSARLAAYRDNMVNSVGSEYQLQLGARQSMQQTHRSSIDLARQTGVRPTLAQLADDRSPYMQHLHVDSSLDTVTLNILSSAIDDVEAQSF